MHFKIQVSNPSLTTPEDPLVAPDLAGAIEAIFQSLTEDAILFWNWIPVRLNYKYDLSVMIDDLLPFLRELLHRDSGTYKIYWGSNTFGADWKVAWSGGHMQIVAQWDAVSGNYEDLLNSRSILECDRSIFLNEWKPLLAKVIEAIRNSCVKITDKHALEILATIVREIGAR